jgi:hypothetical protein
VKNRVNNKHNQRDPFDREGRVGPSKVIIEMKSSDTGTDESSRFILSESCIFDPSHSSDPISSGNGVEPEDR